MKYILMCVGALAVCLVCAGLPARWIGKKRNWSGPATAGAALVLSLVLILAVTFGYLGVYYHADGDAAECSIQPIRIDGGYFFDGPGEDCAMIFYPGAKVETLAYAPLMSRVAEGGVDCFLADMPFRMAIFGSNAADRLLDRYDYGHWIAAGHSMGGLVVSGYVSDHADRFDSLVLLAAYPGKLLPEGVRLYSVYGTRDGCLNLQAYEAARQYWQPSAQEYLLEGGNHAQYAAYGPQSGDLEPGITRQEQLEQTAQIILNAAGYE